MVDKRKYGFREFMCVMDSLLSDVWLCGLWLLVVVVGWPLPPPPSRACQGLPWHGAILIAQRRAGSPIHGSGVEAAPYRGGATRLGWGRIGEEWEEKMGKGARKKDLFL